MFKLETKYCYLLLAIFLAFILNVYTKLSEGFTKVKQSIIALIFTFVLTVFLSFSYTMMDLSIFYPAYSGSVLLLLSVYGIIIFNEELTKYKALGIILIILGIICLFKK